MSRPGAVANRPSVSGAGVAVTPDLGGKENPAVLVAVGVFLLVFQPQLVQAYPFAAQFPVEVGEVGFRVGAGPHAALGPEQRVLRGVVEVLGQGPS